MKKKSKIAFGRLDLLRNDTLNNKNKIRIGFIGGGPNSFIGYTHRLSARFDNKFEFVAGIFSKDKKKSKSFGSSLGLADDRCYSDYKSMASAESKRNDGIQALGIMTPSGDHYKIAKAFIEKGIHIICDKPLTATVEDAVKLKKVILKNKIVFALTHNYSSYPMLREAKNIISNHKLGKINLINVEYPQGYTVGVKKKDEKATLKWRLDKKRGIIWVSSAATGGENGLKIRVYGTKGSIEWLQDDPNNLKFTELDKPMKVITRASKLVSNFSLSSSRIAAGHPEGFFEAFANIYSEFADQIHNKNKKYSFPTIDDGVAGIKFIYAAKKSSNLNSKWVKI